ncbi:precorrin-3B C(17)-methyltransferase [Streptomyces hainanensis]|uniref:Precorrin-3B C(17)-methyltransferase n=1 Tax=Streptomyces hainanensis TaxID=402648 RepID=A0A4R4TH92_9ACTN|nr:precorrin-3B C(17)-methyltransferase [Streptomyces hainanensis]TDC76947.1 precorrin-3B C(17)-methyltransferase [Streptomyces hainanensis]
MIGLISVTAAGAAASARLAAAWPARTRRYPGPAAAAVRRAFAECDQLVCFLATGAAVRLLAPLLTDKTGDPGVVCVDEAGRHAVALLGGHAGGANRLAAEVAAQLPGCAPVVTTATDAVGLPGLDDLGWPAEGDVAGVTRALLDGEPVTLAADAVWPLPALPPHLAPDAAGRRTVAITDRLLTEVAPTDVVLRPPSLVVGLGASRGVPEAEVTDLLTGVLADAGLSPASVAVATTVTAKADEDGLRAAAARLGVDLTPFPAEDLAAVPVPNPSPAPLAAVGTPSVAEAAALLAAGPGAELVVPKRKSAMATCAVARRRPRGRLALVGIGPGARDLLTPRARAELRRASVVVGLDQYLDRIADLLRPGTRLLASGLGAEEERAGAAVAEAAAGHAVALVGSGDAGVYAMASPALATAGDDIDVVGVPGVTAALAAASVLGAPLGHDHAVLSLSDLHTPWAVIERRVTAAAEADLVVAFYNPRSRGRHWQLPAALALLARHRNPDTPVGLVGSATHPGQRHRLTTLGAFDPTEVDMMTLVIVGNSATRAVAGRMVTPRGYRWQA